MRLTWQINWKLTAFTLLFFPLLTYLGFWQLSRAEEKKLILAQWQAQFSAEPADLFEIRDQAIEDGRRIVAYGRYERRKFWLIEGKINGGRPGYDVLMPFLLQDGRWVLVNRGWVPASLDRASLPDFHTPEYDVLLSGRSKTPFDVRLVDESKNRLLKWPHRIIEVDISELEAQFGEKLLTFYLILDSEDVNAFVISDEPVNMPPEKHHAYATQWFAMAFVLLLLWAVSNITINNVLRKP